MKRPIATIVLASALAPLAGAAMARPDVRTMYCADARELVFRKGAIVVTTGDTTYERFVEGQRQCQPFDEIAVPAVAETRDNPECWIGSVCRNRGNFKAGD